MEDNCLFRMQQLSNIENDKFEEEIKAIKNDNELAELLRQLSAIRIKIDKRKEYIKYEEQKIKVKAKEYYNKICSQDKEYMELYNKYINNEWVTQVVRYEGVKRIDYLKEKPQIGEITLKQLQELDKSGRIYYSPPYFSDLEWIIIAECEWYAYDI